MKSVVIIGSNTAIGRCLCKKYAKLGWKIAIVERTENARNAQPIVEECVNVGSPKTVLLKGDLSRETEWRKIVTAINQQIGEAELIIYLDRQNIDRLFKEINQCTAIKKLLENNFNGPVYAIHNFLSTLRKTSGQFVITGALEDKENALDYSSFQAVHGFISTLQREEKNIAFSFFFPMENAQEFPDENVDLLVNSIHQKKQKICLREISRLPKKRESYVETGIDDPPQLKPDTANPLCRAIFKLNKMDVKEIIKNSRNVIGLLEEKDVDGRTALHYASYIGCGEIFTIVARKIKVKKMFNEQDIHHCTPLHLAALRGHILLCKKLIQRYAVDPSVLSQGNMSPLHYLARLDPTDSEFYTLKMKNSFERTLKALMDAGADSNQRNTNWGTPLHEAARSGSLVTIAFLLRNEADIFRKTLDGNETPLHFAIRSGNRRAVAHLLENGADPCAACVNGTCFDIAPTASVCDLLEQYREKNRRQSDTFHARETLVVETLQDLPPDALKMITSSRLTQQEILPHWETLLFLLRFLTKRNYIKRGDPIPVLKKVDAISKTSLGISLFQATERFVSPGNPRKLFKIIEDAGRGGFGTVYKARRLDDKKIVAMKKVPHLSDKEQWNNFDEIHFLQQMGNHANVVRYYTSYFSRDELWIIMEFLEGGTLSEVIGRVKLDENNICYVAKNIIKGLKDMHRLKVVHRDLKSANIMLDVAANVKLIDFGLCIDVTNTKPEYMVGSPFWIPPEMMNKTPHGPAADIWSLGILCLEMANRSAPNRFSSLKAMFEVGIGNIPTLDQPDKWSKAFKSFLDRMLVINPDQRASAKDLLEDPWIKNLSRNAVNDMREILRNIFLEKSMELSMV